LIVWLGVLSRLAPATKSVSESNAPQKVIIDTDIGDDVDDAFCFGVGLA